MSLSYQHAGHLAREAFHLCFSNETSHAQELLQQSYNTLRRLSGDLSIVGHEQSGTSQLMAEDAPFVTHSFEEARAWGWFELATGIFKLVQDRPGTSLVHFKRAWRIWRPWGMVKQQEQETIAYEARYERIRVSLWLGEAWSRFMSDRAEHAACAVLRAALAELTRISSSTLLQETISQQAMLPPAQLGTPAYRQDNRTVPYICTLLNFRMLEAASSPNTPAASPKQSHDASKKDNKYEDE